MSTQLGIDLGSTGTMAALAHDDELEILSLGAAGAAMPTVVHVAGNGSVTVGDAAVSKASDDPEGLVTDLKQRIGDDQPFAVNGHAVTSEVLVSHLMAAILARSATVSGGPPDLVVVTHPPSWSVERRDALLGSFALIQVEAVAMTETEAAASLQRHGHRVDDPAEAIALGAAALAADTAAIVDIADATGSTPIVTREDLEGPATEAVVPVAPPPPSSIIVGSASVFDDEPDDVMAAAPVAPPPPPVVDDYDYEDYDDYPDTGETAGDSRAKLAFLVVAGILLTAIVALAAVLLTRGGDDDPEVVVAPSTTVFAATTTTPGATTTDPATTSTTTTTTTSTTTTTTTTSLVPLPSPGVVALEPDGLLLDPGSSAERRVVFGTLGETVLDTIQSVLGRPDRDTGLRSDPDCDAEVRRLEWGDLQVIFLAGDASIPGPETFVQWATRGNGSQPRGLVSIEGIGVGASVAQMVDARPDIAFLGTLFSLGALDDDHIEGIVDSPELDGEVDKLWAGLGCDQISS